MLNLFDYDFGVRLIKPDPNIYYRTIKKRRLQSASVYVYAVISGSRSTR